MKAAGKTYDPVTYDGAGHGFNCEQRGSYDPPAAALARTRTLEFFARYVDRTAGAAPPSSEGDSAS